MPWSFDIKNWMEIDDNVSDLAFATEVVWNLIVVNKQIESKKKITRKHNVL